MTLNCGIRIDDLELVAIRGDGEILARHDGDHGESRACRLPALRAAANVIMRGVASDADRYGVGVALTFERSAGEIRLPLFDTVIDGRVYGNIAHLGRPPYLRVYVYFAEDQESCAIRRCLTIPRRYSKSLKSCKLTA
jgi:hypothetical protein